MTMHNSLNYIKLLGARAKQYRIKLGMSQNDLVEKTGLSVRTISRFEQGSSIQLDALVKILISLGIEENINLLIEDQTIRPSFYLSNNSTSNKRVKRKTISKNSFVWGEDR